jgi:hypothetical protein
LNLKRPAVFGHLKDATETAHHLFSGPDDIGSRIGLDVGRLRYIEGDILRDFGRCIRIIGDIRIGGAPIASHIPCEAVLARRARLGAYTRAADLIGGTVCRLNAGNPTIFATTTSRCNGGAEQHADESQRATQRGS